MPKPPAGAASKTLKFRDVRTDLWISGVVLALVVLALATIAWLALLHQVGKRIASTDFSEVNAKAKVIGTQVELIRKLISIGRSSFLHSQTQDENWNACTSEDPERSIAGCSALIQSGQQTGINLAKAFYGRGSAYAQKGDYDHAIQDYDQTVRLNPSLANAFYGRGWAYEHKDDYNHAIQDFNQALRLNPDLAIAVRERGLAYTHKGDYEQAIRDYTEALRLNQSDPIGFYNRGLAHAHQGDHDHAIQDYDQACG